LRRNRISRFQSTIPAAPKQSLKEIDFSLTKDAFKNKQLSDLLRGWLVFTTCRVRPLVKYADSLIKLSNMVIGQRLTNYMLQKTFFGHFCAGVDQESIKPVTDSLGRSGVGSILDYAAESDLLESIEKEPGSSLDAFYKHLAYQSLNAKVRIYDYKSEEICDSRMRTFEKCIEAANSVSGSASPGFAAIKVSALGNPELLKRAAITLVELQKLFYKLDPEGTGYVTKEQFVTTFNTKIEGKEILSYFDIIDVDQDGKLDYIEWTELLPLEELHLVTAFCTEAGPLSTSVLEPHEQELFKAMKNRLRRLALLAQKLGVRLMIDAEQSYFQPAIDNLVVGRMKEFNGASSDFPVIFNTYQMYLKDSQQRYTVDMQRAHQGGYKFAAKIVRGAYMHMERKHAEDNGAADPIYASLEDTHASYNGAIEETIRNIGKGREVEIMIATHNQQSVELALKLMKEHGLSAGDGVFFGQLLGMSDFITLPLGLGGYKAYKYVPYGAVDEVMPYLLRRAQENSDLLGGAKLEIELINKEIKRRLFSQ
jgi:proline dehydrogenase